MVSKVILQASFRPSREKVALIAHSSSLRNIDVCIKCIVFMCLFLSTGYGETEMEMLRMLEVKLLCMHHTVQNFSN